MKTYDFVYIYLLIDLEDWYNRMYFPAMVALKTIDLHRKCRNSGIFILLLSNFVMRLIMLSVVRNRITK